MRERDLGCEGEGAEEEGFGVEEGGAGGEVGALGEVVGLWVGGWGGGRGRGGGRGKEVGVDEEQGARRDGGRGELRVQVEGCGGDVLHPSNRKKRKRMD